MSGLSRYITFLSPSFALAVDVKDVYPLALTCNVSHQLVLMSLVLLLQGDNHQAACINEDA